MLLTLNIVSDGLSDPAKRPLQAVNDSAEAQHL